MNNDIHQHEDQRHNKNGSNHWPRLDRLGDRYSDENGRQHLGNEEVVKDLRADPTASALPPVKTVDDGNEDQHLLDMRNLDGVPTALFHPGAWTFGYEARDQLFLQALAAAERIRAIVLACTHRGVPIRWFQHSKTRANGGKPGLLTPLNAVQVDQTRPRRIAALHYLALSTANRLSLTFCSQPGPSHPGVVFSADSDLRHPCPIPWRAGMIVTAPHHGSEANAAAYARFNHDTKKKFGVIWDA